jgi:hypothetical protein
MGSGVHSDGLWWKRPPECGGAHAATTRIVPVIIM